MKFRRHALIGVLGMFVAGAAACGDSKDGDDGGELTAPRLSGAGESCARTADCTEPLLCMDRVCRPEPALPLTPTGKVCSFVDCKAPADCCVLTETAEQCRLWLEACRFDKAACFSHAKFCTCDLWECNSGQCEQRQPCGDDSGAICTGRVCNGTKCVDCMKDGDCQGTQKCVADKCKSSCSGDNECDTFFACRDGVCVESGCATDRECVALERDARALCRDKRCTIPCQTDVECRVSADAEFRACVDGMCQDVGCETDQECRIRLNTSAPNSPSKDAVCAPKAG